MKKGNMQTKEKILVVAEKLFKEKGYHQVTVQEIADISGISKNTFYYHFKSKIDLISQVAPSIPVTLPPERMEQVLLVESYFERYWLVIEPYIYYFAENDPIFMGMLWETQFNTAKKRKHIFRPRNGNFVGMEMVLLQKAQDSGEIKNSSAVADLVKICFTHIWTFGYMWIIQRGEFDLARAVRNAIEVTLDVREDIRKEKGYLDVLVKES